MEDAMGFRGYQHQQNQKVERPAAIGLVSIVGILASFLLFGLEFAVIWLRSQRGLPFMAQAIDLAVAGGIVLLLVWIYWGVWDLFPSAWSMHIFLGLPLVAGFGYVAWAAPEIAPIIAHQMPNAEVALATTVLRIVAGGMAAIELATFLVLLASRSAFKVGQGRPIWDRVKY
jgi:hypothetical protein